MRNQRSFSLEFKRQVVEEPCTTLPPVQHHLKRALPLEEAVQLGVWTDEAGKKQFLLQTQGKES